MCDAHPVPDPGPEEVAAVRAVVTRLGLPGIVDVHTHFMPARVLQKVWAYFDRMGPLTARPWPITYRFDEPTRVRRLSDFGVVAFTSMIYPHKPDMAEWLNGWAAEFARATPACLHTATFFPEPSAADYVRRAIADGARVFKAHVQVGDYDPRDPLLEPVWAELERTRVPTVIHAGSGPTPGRFTGPGPVAEVLRRHPDLRLIVAHLGMPEYREFLDLAARYPGVYLDTTMAFTDFAERLHPLPADARADLAALADKVLFGSDFPNIPYPYRHALESLIRLGLGDEWCRKVLYHNAVALFGLDHGNPETLSDADHA
ncbi:amidohydrolase family protein [uncultured Mycolicibacterium sp.]|uniref:amidohydrolase family protein n=1 Tax=uncultured Mycolicibacterium sp. TaxID=2320817 RepID=UPI00262D70CC|nr:amidohydrolase family protein [uncultured Mycolicibacterium sp.]